MAIYLDHNATTPLHPAVLEAMQPYMGAICGNASSLHRYGRLHKDAIAQAREQLAALLDARADQVIFTSGGTEANNLLLKGFAAKSPASRMALSAIEHMSMLEPAEALQKQGSMIDLVECNEHGCITADALHKALQPDTKLVSVMAANNETGAIQDIATLAAIVRAQGAYMHSDASQAAGKIKFSFADSGVHAMTVSAHKFYGPLGAGALILDPALPLSAMLHGGSQEKHLRAGTENVPAIVGFGKAAELALAELDTHSQHVRSLRDALEAGLSEFSNVRIFAQQVERLPNTVQFGVAGFDGETLLMQLDRKGIAVSSGSACTSGKTEPSHVLKAMRVDNDFALGAVRVSFGAGNTLADVDALLRALTDIMQLQRSEVMMAASI
ncbi:MAG: cysteine desulfurase family protein [Gammaproteobacteria bacterium]